MSDIIQLLPDSVANQIAAGEVIQRPASVIKELVENAVDAGAKTIHVSVVDAGRTSIEVIDDGRGMSETDARLAFERHATSKIRQADDLFALHTMGFRGEALASIAAVAQVTLTTRMADDEVGTQLCIAGSKVQSQEPVACAVGSRFTVENLFFNVPARRKFLKANSTELGHIMDAFERIVLVYPEISFTIHSNGTEVLNVRAGSLKQRIADVFGKRYVQELLPVNVETTMCKITGFTGKPEAARKKGAHTFFFVNGRYMRHPYFHKAVMEAYERMLPTGMQVPYFLYFEVAPADIDVNIHPVKTEIKFENEQVIWQILMAAVRDAIGKFCEVPTIDFDTKGKPEIPVFDPSRRSATPPSLEYNPSYNPFKERSRSAVKPLDHWTDLYDGIRKSPQEADQSLFEPLDENSVSAPADKIIEDRSPAHYQYKATYIMTAVKSGLMVIDQHRADVRIRYERYLKMLEEKTSTPQRMLFPEIIQFSPSEGVVVRRILPDLAAMGFELSDMGQDAYALNGVPAGLEGINYVTLVRQMVSDATEKERAMGKELYQALALSMARHAAIPQGQILNNEEMEYLVNELFACSNVNYTPDGKPVLCILPQQEIEQLLA